MAKLSIAAQPRTVTGKRVKNLRRQGLLPANVYGHNLQSQPLQLDAHSFSLLQRHLSASSILDLIVADGPARPVMVHRTQRSVRTGAPIHIEFFQVNMLEKLTASVPLVLTGESELVRRGEAIVLQELDTIEVTSLPGDLPMSIEVPIDKLTEVGASIHVGDLIYDRAKLEIKANPEDRVVGLMTPQMHAEEEPIPAEAAHAGAQAAEGTSSAENSEA